MALEHLGNIQLANQKRQRDLEAALAIPKPGTEKVNPIQTKSKFSYEYNKPSQTLTYDQWFALNPGSRNTINYYNYVKEKEASEKGGMLASLLGGGGTINLSEVTRESPQLTNLLMESVAGGEWAGQQLPEQKDIYKDTALAKAMQLREQSLGGMSSPQMEALRSQGVAGINAQTQAAQRQLMAAQARSGVRGGVAGSQLANILGQGIQQRANFEQGLLANQYGAQQQALSDYEQSAANRFAISQDAANRLGLAKIGAGIGFAQIGAAQRGAKAQM